MKFLFLIVLASCGIFSGDDEQVQVTKNPWNQISDVWSEAWEKKKNMNWKAFDEAFDQAKKITISDEKNRALELIYTQIEILENEIKAGNQRAMEFLWQLFPMSDGHFTENLMRIANESFDKNAEKTILFFKKNKEKLKDLPYFIPVGEKYVDNEFVRALDLQSKIKLLESIRNDEIKTEVMDLTQRLKSQFKPGLLLKNFSQNFYKEKAIIRNTNFNELLFVGLFEEQWNVFLVSPFTIKKLFQSKEGQQWRMALEPNTVLLNRVISIKIGGALQSFTLYTHEFDCHLNACYVKQPKCYQARIPPLSDELTQDPYLWLQGAITGTGKTAKEQLLAWLEVQKRQNTTSEDYIKISNTWDDFLENCASGAGAK